MQILSRLVSSFSAALTALAAAFAADAPTAGASQG